MAFKEDDSRMNRRSFLAHSSIALATMAGTSLIGAGTYVSGQAAAEESVQVKSAYGNAQRQRLRLGKLPAAPLVASGGQAPIKLASGTKQETEQD
jgi:nitrous oxide reductase